MGVSCCALGNKELILRRRQTNKIYGNGLFVLTYSLGEYMDKTKGRHAAKMRRRVGSHVSEEKTDSVSTVLEGSASRLARKFQSLPFQLAKKWQARMQGLEIQLFCRTNHTSPSTIYDNMYNRLSTDDAHHCLGLARINPHNA